MIAIDDLSVRAGALPPRALGLVMEWADKNRAALEDVWRQAEQHEPLSTIPPLE